MKKEIRAKQTQFDSIDAATKVGVVGGIVGVAVNTAFRGSKNNILAWTSVGGLSYLASHDLTPTAYQSLYDAAITDLECIDAAGYDTNAALIASSLTLDPLRLSLEAATTKLNDDVNSLGPDPTHQSDIYTAKTVISVGRQYDRRVWQFEQSTAVAEHMIRAVDATVDALNTQLRSAEPNIDTIYKASSLSTIYPTDNSGVTQQSASVSRQLAQLQQPVAQDGDPVPTRLLMEEAAVSAVVSKISAAISAITIDTGSIGRCQAQLNASTSLPFTPASPVGLNAGSEVSISPDGTPPYTIVWPSGGTMPSDLNLIVNSATQTAVRIQAVSTAAEKTYNFTITDSAKRSTAQIQLQVHAVSAQNAAAPQP